MSLTVCEIQSLTKQDKFKLKNCERPMPDLNQKPDGNKVFVSFDRDWYRTNDWLCGCEIRNALFCFPCLLVGEELIWAKEGLNRFNNFQKLANFHETSTKHIENAVKLAFHDGKGDFTFSDNVSLNEYNDKIRKNRDTLLKMMNCIKAAGNLKALNFDSDNLDIFKTAIDFACILDADLKSNLTHNEIFDDINNIIKELLDCMLCICQSFIIEEIKKSPFVAVMVDNISDISEIERLALSFRYEYGGDVRERFWGFLKTENESEDAIATSILEKMDQVLNGSYSKVIALTYNGPIKSEEDSVHQKIKQSYTNAHFVHCYTHGMHEFIKNASSIMVEGRIFFANLSKLLDCFKTSPFRLSVLNKHIDIANINYSGYNFSIPLLDDVYEQRDTFVRCFEELQSTVTTDETVQLSTAMLKVLKDTDFHLWLELFYQIMPHIASLHMEMQNINLDYSNMQGHLYNFHNAFLNIEQNLNIPDDKQTTERKRICNIIRFNLMQRYMFVTHVVAAKLFCKENFDVYREHVPVTIVTELCKAFPMLEQEKLSRELQAFYLNEILHDFESLVHLLRNMYKSSLKDVFKEVTKVLRILVTIPVPTDEYERCSMLSTSIRTYLSSANPTRMATNIAMVTLEKDMIESIPHFNDQVLDRFCKPGHRTKDFCYRTWTFD